MADFGRLRFSIDIVGEHAMNDAIGLQLALKEAARKAVGPAVKLDLLPSYKHTAGCDWCRRSADDPAWDAHPLPAE
jgi:hypothetical protein